MKTSLQFLSFVAAAAVPSTFVVQFLGVSLPAGCNAASAFAAFVVSLVVLTAHGDYSRKARPLAAAVPARSNKAIHALAA